MTQRRFGNIVFILGTNKGRYPFCNSILIDDGEKALIDAGSDQNYLSTIAPEVGSVIYSHYHEDHIGFGYLFQHALVMAHVEDAPCFKSLETLLDHYGLTGTEYDQEWHDIMRQQFNYKERETVIELHDGDVMRFGDTAVEVVHTPGHTSGHCSFWFPNERVLSLSDLDMTGFGPWYGDRVSDIDQTIASVRKLLSFPARYYVASHEDKIITSDLETMARAYLEIIVKRDEKIMAFIGVKPRTLSEIVNQWFIYERPREPLNFFESGERALVLKHLDRAVAKGFAAYDGERYSLLPEGTRSAESIEYLIDCAFHKLSATGTMD